jgi:hypothetical protein
MPSKYDEQTPAKAVRLVPDHRDDYVAEWEAIKTVSGRCGGTAACRLTPMPASRRSPRRGVSPWWFWFGLTRGRRWRLLVPVRRVRSLPLRRILNYVDYEDWSPQPQQSGA